MMANTVCEMLEAQVGLPMRAIPLSMCHIIRPYLLDRAGIPTGGTAILFTIPYVIQADVDNVCRNVSLYAVPEDYHVYVRELGGTLLPLLSDRFPGHRFALFSDHSPIAEVDAAARAGLGVMGENHLLITPEWGSYVFIAELVTDMPYETVTRADVDTIPLAPPRCDGCGLCTRACPALHALDGICLSALTQKKGTLSDAEESALAAHSLVWGCDACQTVCPHNRRVMDTPIAFFRENRLPYLDLTITDTISDADFSRRAYAWRGRSVIERNLRLKEDRRKGETS